MTQPPKPTSQDGATAETPVWAKIALVVIGYIWILESFWVYYLLVESFLAQPDGLDAVDSRLVATAFTYAPLKLVAGVGIVMGRDWSLAFALPLFMIGVLDFPYSVTLVNFPFSTVSSVVCLVALFKTTHFR